MTTFAHWITIMNWCTKKNKSIYQCKVLHIANNLLLARLRTCTYLQLKIFRFYVFWQVDKPFILAISKTDRKYRTALKVYDIYRNSCTAWHFQNFYISAQPLEICLQTLPKTTSYFMLYRPIINSHQSVVYFANCA